MVRTMSDTITGGVRVEWIVEGLLPDLEALELLTPLAVAVDGGAAPGLDELVEYEAE